VAAPSALFSTVPERDFAGFGMGDALNAKAVVDFFGFKKAEVSKIAQVSPSSVRWDDAIPQKVSERLQEIASIVNLVAGIFEGDIQKTVLWFRAPNPLLGDVSPRDMIRLGRYDKLRKFIISAIAESARSPSPPRKKATGAKAKG
jgi:hypothetical protein